MAAPHGNKNGLKHGMAASSEYLAWRNARSRCLNPRNRNYPHYGGRGIRMCESWRESFDSFIEDMGRKPSPLHSLDRIDSDGDYEPGNCRWSTLSEQNRNKRNNRTMRFDGRVACVAEVAALTGIKFTTLVWRLDRGWSHEEACGLTRRLKPKRQHSSEGRFVR